MPSQDGSHDAIRLWFRGRAREVRHVPPTLSVLHWLREDEACTGTKEGCNQGDCGACTVVVGELRDDRVVLHTANSCLLPLAHLHGKALFTVEDVARPGALHPVQQALVEHGGSQCGFCTPGFVMSLWCAFEQNRMTGGTFTRADATEAISGNLCRCTGYRPILDAAVAAADAPEGAGWSHVRTALETLNPQGTLRLTHGAATFVAPDTEESLADELRARPSAKVIAGGTDLILSLRTTGEDFREDLTLISTERVPSLRKVEETDTHLSIGAATPLEDAWRAITERSASLDRMHQRFASPAIRAVGTIGGNIANASPIADLTPVLLALDAAVLVRSREGGRTVALGDFATGVRTTVLQPGEFVSRIVIPKRAFERAIRAYKVSRRFDDDISSVSAVVALELEGDVITDLRVVFGGMATTVRRASAAETALRGKVWNAAALAEAQAAVTDEFTPITDHRATAHYRLRAAAGLLHRCWLETGTDAAPIPVDVWAQA